MERRLVGVKCAAGLVCPVSPDEGVVAARIHHLTSLSSGDTDRRALNLCCFEKGHLKKTIQRGSRVVPLGVEKSLQKAYLKALTICLLNFILNAIFPSKGDHSEFGPRHSMQISVLMYPGLPTLPLAFVYITPRAFPLSI